MLQGFCLANKMQSQGQAEALEVCVGELGHSRVSCKLLPNIAAVEKLSGKIKGR